MQKFIADTKKFVEKNKTALLILALVVFVLVLFIAFPGLALAVYMLILLTAAACMFYQGGFWNVLQGMLYVADAGMAYNNYKNARRNQAEY